MRTGGKIVVDHLMSEGVRHLFMVPGESFLGILDALHEGTPLHPVTARNEAGAAMMAAATGRLTGVPGVALVTRGPGAANALAGVYVAEQDQAPMVLLVGLPPRAKKGLPTFQRIDLAGTFGAIAKHVAIAESPALLPQHLAFAFRLAQSGRPGPVVLGLPEDVLLETTKNASARPAPLVPASPTPDDLERLNALLAHADRPLLIAGAPLWSAQAALHLARFAERYDLPVAAAFRRQDCLDNAHPCYCGHLGFAADPSLVQAARRSDLVIVLGQCLNEVTTQGFTLLDDSEESTQKLVLIAADASNAPPPYAPLLSIAACPAKTVEALAILPTPGKRPPWPDWRRDLRTGYEAPTLASTAGEAPRLALDHIVAHLSQVLSAQAIVCSGAGAYAAVLHRHFAYRAHPGQLAPLSGSMGYGLPAAIAAQLAHPDRQVVAIAGDGCLQMTIEELGTLAQLNLPIVIVLVNNAALGSIRNAQIARLPQRVVGTSLVNPDFVRLAGAYGLKALRVDHTADFAQALTAALSTAGPALIELDTCL